MATDEVQLTAAESRRAEAIAELIEENGPQWQQAYAPGTFGCHELLDRVSVIANLIEEQLLEHPACLQKEHWFEFAESAAAALHQLYQEIGKAHLECKSSQSG